MPVDIPVPPLERVVRLASRTLNAPVAVASFFDGPRVLYHRDTGVDVTPHPDDVSLCQSIAESQEPTVVNKRIENVGFTEVARHREQSSLDYVLGTPLRLAPSGTSSTSTRAVGALYVGGSSPDTFSSEDRVALRDLGILLEEKLAEDAQRSHGSALPQRLPEAVLTIDPHGGASREATIASANEAVTSLTGYTRRELINKPLSILSGPETDTTALQPLYSEASSASSPFTVELVNYGSDGQKLYLDWNLAPLPDDTEGPSQWVAFVHEGTQRLRLEDELRQRRTIERNETLREISQSILSASSTEAVAEAALERLASVVPYEQASVLECSASDGTISLLAIDDWDALSDDITEEVLLQHFQTEEKTLLRDSRLVDPIPEEPSDPVEKYLLSQGVQSYLNVPLRAEDEVIGFLNLGAPRPGTYGKQEIETAREVADMVAVALQQAHYREQLLEAKEEAERMNRLKTAFLANMSHEIRTPLTSIVGFADVLTDYDLGEADRFTRLIARSGEQLLETIDSVLSLSKLETGSMNPTFEQVNVCEEITDAVELAMPRAETTDVTVRADVPAHSIETELDRSAFRRILQNLVSNAIKFTDAGGTVTVRTRLQNDTIVLQVEDTGVGIDENFLPHLFKPFEQEAAADPDEDSGTGLGLAVTKRLVELLNGSIEVESTKGVGTTFTIRIPK